MRKLDLHTLRRFIGPFFLTFFIALVVLLMQFIWKYIDDLAGKGLEWHVIGELLVYTSATLVPLALPLAVLLSSIMTFGSLAEHLELVAAKASGISLLRVMRPVMWTSAGLSLLAFVFSDRLMPAANLKMRALIMDIQDQKPAMDIKPGIFYSDLEKVALRAEQISRDKKWLFNVLIYDHSDPEIGNSRVIVAESATVHTTSDRRYLILELYNGQSYMEEKFYHNRDPSFPHITTRFKRQEIRVDISDFQLQRQSEALYRGHYTMLGLTALSREIRELEGEHQNRLRNLTAFILRTPPTIPMHAGMEVPASGRWRPGSPPLNVHLNLDNLSQPNWHEKLPPEARTYLNTQAALLLSQTKARLSDLRQEFRFRRENLARYKVEWHRKFTLSAACLLMFFIGAPLGAIIRKGGLGLPLVASVLIFILYYILSTLGEKAAKQLTISAGAGMWLSTLIMLPMGLWLMMKANYDSPILQRETYVQLWRQLRQKAKL
ncbi:MAG: LptF/LptG family permease [Flavobacteriales bacterium]|nr:LptF/LptG family permease [Flavobacteriales bacterium]MCX7768505.1 LptF/LptG family permease [Flavobacteriales bacterium]MDW8409837.1 LptF/LptG family permease [Flavobacteriales bacterium]